MQRLTVPRSPVAPARVVAHGALVLLLGAPLVVAAALGWGVYATALLGLAFAMVAGMYRWQWSVLGLLAFMPFCGVPSYLLYPNTGPAVLLKDVYFVIPAYVGFFGTRLRGRQAAGVPGALTGLFLVFAALVMIFVVVTPAPNYLVGLVGAKVWLFYIPLFALGYHLASTVDELRGIWRLIGIVGAVALALGVVQAVLLYTGHAALAYRFYGEAAFVATQNLAIIEYDSGQLVRNPGIFTSMTAYYNFTVAMIAVSYAWWRVEQGRWRSFALFVFLLANVSAMTTGARGAFVMVPLLLAGILLLDGRGPPRPRASLLALIAAGGGFMTLSYLMGAPVLTVARQTSALPSQYLRLFGDVAATVFRTSLLGQGTGTNTSATRYVLGGNSGGGDRFTVNALQPLAQGQESWWLKIVIELGIVGLVIAVTMFAVLIVGGLRRHVCLRSPTLRASSAALIVYLGWHLINNFKSYFMDLDPTNVYFWLFAGLMLRIAWIDAHEVGASVGEVTAGRAPGRRPAATARIATRR